MDNVSELRHGLEEMLSFLPDAVRTVVVASAIQQMVSKA